MAGSLQPDLDWLHAMNATGQISPETAASLQALYGGNAPPPAPAPTSAEIPPIVMPATPGNLPPSVASKEAGDAAAMSAVAAKMGGADPFAAKPATAMMPENSAQLAAMGVQPKPIPTAGAALKGVPNVTAETTGFVPKIGATAPLATGGGPKPMGTGGPAKPLTLADMEAKVYSPGQRKLNALGEEEIKAQGARDVATADIQAELANHNAVQLQNAQEVAEDIVAENQAREEQRQRLIAAAHDSLQTKWDELSKTEIDPERYWNNKDTGEKVMATMGIILAGIGGALTGQGGNVALDRMNAEINRDVEAQKATYMMKSDSLKAKQSLFGQMMAEYGDERLADQATLATHWKMVENQLSVFAAQSQNAMAKQNAADAMKFASLQVGKYQAGLEAQTEQLYKKMTAPVGPSPMDKEFQKADMAHAFKIADALGGQVQPTKDGRFVVVKDGAIVWDGTSAGTNSGVPIKQYGGLNAEGKPTYTYGGKSLNAKQAEKHNLAASKLGKIEEIDAKAKKLHDEYGTELFGTDASKEAEQLARDAKAAGVNLPDGFNFTDPGNKWTTWKSAVDSAKAEATSELQTHEVGSENAPLSTAGAASGDGEEEEP